MEKRQLNEDNIDLVKLVDIAIEHKKEVVSIIAGCTIFAVGISFVLPTKYESTTLVQTRSAGKDISSATTIASMMGISIGGSSSNDSPNNYIELMKSRHVLEPVIDSLEWGDEEHKPTAEGFAKSCLDIKNTKKTNLITVTAKGRTPEEAQQISQGVVDNFLILQTDMNQQTQSLLVKFLNERIEKARGEADEAARKLANYSKEHKVYAPEEQSKMAIEKLNAYDKAISDVIVQQKSAQAEYETAATKIGQQKINAKAYNINDNSIVQSLRASIVEKQMELVGYRQLFTEEHPKVKQAQDALEDLNRQLVNEVNMVVDSGTSTLNPVYAELLKNQAVAEAQISAATASEIALKEKKAEAEKEIGDLPDVVMNYIQLESDAKLKQEVYLSLVKQCEQDKVQEAMESMDIQVIDSANLPKKDKPTSPKRGVISLVGLLIGMLLAAVYSAIIYRKNI